MSSTEEIVKPTSATQCFSQKTAHEPFKTSSTPKIDPQTLEILSHNPETRYRSAKRIADAILKIDQELSEKS